MTIISYLMVFAQSASNAYDMAIARCAFARAAGVAAESIIPWMIVRACAVCPCRSRRVASRMAGDGPRPLSCAESVTAPGKAATTLHSARAQKRSGITVVMVILPGTKVTPENGAGHREPPVVGLLWDRRPP